MECLTSDTALYEGGVGLEHLLPNCSNVTSTNNEVNEFAFVQLVDNEGNETGSPIWLPLNITPDKLAGILNGVLSQEDERSLIYDFYVGDVQLLDDLRTALAQVSAKHPDTQLSTSVGKATSLESVIRVIYQAQAVFRVRPVTRCTSTLPGHKGAVLVAQFSPDARCLATGSGDQTVRFWDLNTELPMTTGVDAHHAPVLCLAWAPDGCRLASGCQGGVVCLWEESGVTGLWTLSNGHPLTRPSMTSSCSKGKWVRSLVWRPLHLDADCRKLAVAYQDSSLVIWDTWTGQPLVNLHGHDKPVVCVRWGGSDLLYSASQDRTIRVWRSTDGVLCRTLTLHGHWVNCLALSTDYVLRTGSFDPAHATFDKPLPPAKSDTKRRDVMRLDAQSLYEKVKGSGPERLVAGSDDNTLSLWQPELDKKPLAPRMIGHQGVVNDVKFSPDARVIASASFDHSVKIWDGFTGQFLATLFGHVQEVYLVAWSGDSRLLVSCSKDSTLKLWSLTEVRRWGQEAATLPSKERKKQIFAADVAGKGSEKSVHQKRRHLLHDLPGHADAVYALDWSPDGQRVVSGGKDRVLKIWRA